MSANLRKRNRMDTTRRAQGPQLSPCMLLLPWSMALCSPALLDFWYLYCSGSRHWLHMRMTGELEGKKVIFGSHLLIFIFKAPQVILMYGRIDNM